MIKTIITFIRHGETEWNRSGKQQGHQNSNLTSRGIRQAEMIGKFLDTKSYDLIYSSDLKRALHTAQLINEQLNILLIKNKNLRERKLGIMEGLTRDEFKTQYPHEFKLFTSDIDYIIPQGESSRQFYQRTVSAVDEIADAHPGKKILVVTHGGNLSCIFRKVFDIPLDKKRNFSLLNTSLNTFEINNRQWKLISWGNAIHLENNDPVDDF
ncbi:MAG: hypothetical protein APR63_05010 [Desulfuromonas sp. SDB]|nr:MAG: hypothetical protein APR63_05010 [Desulfuromonas sp. SDB]